MSGIATEVNQGGNAVSDAVRAKSTLFYNGRIYASSDEFDLASPYSWMSMCDGRIIELSRSDSTPSPSSYAKSHDLGGATILPGLIDAHIHVLMTGRNACQIQLQGCKTIEEMQQRIKTFMAKQQGDETNVPLVGMGWEQDEIGRYPTKADLDAVTNRPLILWRICSHILVANSAALQAASIDASTPNPAGGAIDYTAGILKETATELLRPQMEWMDTPERQLYYIRTGLRMCVENGLTAVQTNDENTWHLYTQLADRDELPLRVFLTIQQEEIGKEGRPKPKQQHGPLLQCHRVKLFADGALGAETASLSMPYVLPHRCAANHAHAQHTASAEASTASTSSSNYGLLIHSSSSLQSKVSFAHSQGFRVELHAIGDRAAEEGLNAFEKAGLTKADRPILTHCQVLREDLIARMAKHGVIADVQPQFTVTDSKWAKERLPEQLLRYSYCWKTLLNAGVHVAGGSDAPIELPNPFLGIHAAIFRPTQQYPLFPPTEQPDATVKEQPLPPIKPSDQWRPSECLSVSEALHLYTRDAAYAAAMESKLGFLAVGGVADFVVIDRDVLRQPEEMVRVRVRQVYVDGVSRK